MRGNNVKNDDENGPLSYGICSSRRPLDEQKMQTIFISLKQINRGQLEFVDTPDTSSNLYPLSWQLADEIYLATYDGIT